MRYRQSLMKYADKYGVSQAPEIQQESVVHLFLAGTLGRKCGIPGLSVPAATQSPQPAYRGGTETDPGYAPQKSNTWNGGTMASVETAGLHPPPKQQKPYKPKPYERITFLGQRVQVDVKVVPAAVSPTRSCAFTCTPPLTNSSACVSSPPILNSLLTPPLIS